MLAADGFDLLQPGIGLLELAEGDLLFEQRLALRADPGVALDRPTHALGGQPVGVILAFNEDEAATAAVLRVGLEDGVRRGAGAGEGVEDQRVLVAGLVDLIRQNRYGREDGAHALCCSLVLSG